MQCKAIQIQLSAGQVLSEEEKGHLAACKACKEFLVLQNAIENTVTNLRPSVPDPDLKGRIYDVVYRQPRVSTPKNQGLRRLVYMAASAVCLGLIAGGLRQEPVHRSPIRGDVGKILFAFAGGGMAEASFHTMQSKVSHAQSAHIELWGTYDSTGKPISEIRKLGDSWWRPGAWRKSDAASLGGDRLVLSEADGLHYLTYDSGSRRVIDEKEEGKQLEAFTVEDIVNSYNTDVKGLTIESPVTTADGDRIVAHSDDGYHQYVFRTDPKTHELAFVQMQHKVGQEYVSYFELKFELNNVSDSKFNPNDLIPKP